MWKFERVFVKFSQMFWQSLQLPFQYFNFIVDPEIFTHKVSRFSPAMSFCRTSLKKSTVFL